MSWQVTTEKLSAYLDRELPEEERLELEAELERDPSARERLESLRRTVEDLRRLGAARAPVTLEGRVARAIAAERERVSWLDRIEGGLSVLGPQSTIFVMFAVVIALAVMILLFSQALERSERAETQVVFAEPDAEGLVEGDRLEMAERIFRRTGGVWVERGVDPVKAERVIESGTAEAAELLEEHPELEALLREGGTYVVEIDSQILRLELSG